MRISKVSIRNFRSVRELEVELPQTCALVGPNNVGKSNILLAIQKVIGSEWLNVSNFDEDDVCGRDENCDIEITLQFDPAIRYRRFKAADPAEITTLSFKYTRYKVGDDKGQRRLEQKCMNEGKPVFVPKTAPRKGVKLEFEPLPNVPQEIREQIPLIYIGTNRSLKEQLPGARYSLLRKLFEDIDRDFNKTENQQTGNSSPSGQPVLPRAQRFRKLLNDAMDELRTDDFVSLENSIKRNALRLLGFDPDIDSDVLDFFFAPFDSMDFYKALDLRVKERDFTISASELGDGVQNALVLSILQAFEERRKQGAILLIEEPEMFLHPQMQRSLYKTLRKIGETNQVIYTTHSPHFVSVPDYNEVLLVRKSSSGTTVCTSNLPTSPKRREKLIKELDPERSELFFANRLLLVEGDTEKLALPEYAAQLGLDLDREGATIVEVGGKRNLPEFADIATSFGVPTGVLYDADSKEFGKKDDEALFNAELDKRVMPDGKVRVWSFPTNYEDSLRSALGETKYQELCQKYSGSTKPVRARLIACEEGLAIPEPLEEALHWLVNKPGGQKNGREETKRADADR